MSESFIAFGRFEEGHDPNAKTLMFSGNAHEVTGLEGKAAHWNQVLSQCDGSRTLAQVSALNTALEPQAISEFLDTLAHSNLAYRTDSGEHYLSGDEAILIIEDL